MLKLAHFRLSLVLLLGAIGCSQPTSDAPIESKPALKASNESKPALDVPTESKSNLMAPAESKPIVKGPASQSGILAPDAVKQIRRIAAENQLDWSQTVMLLSITTDSAGEPHFGMNFKLRAELSEKTHVFLDCDGIPVAFAKDKASQFDGVRVEFGEKNGAKGFIFERSGK